MVDEDKDNINNVDDAKVDENQPLDENKSTESETVKISETPDDNKVQSQPEGESSANINEKSKSIASLRLFKKVQFSKLKFDLMIFNASSDRFMLK